MDNPMRDFEDALLQIYMDNYGDPVPWIDWKTGDDKKILKTCKNFLKKREQFREQTALKILQQSKNKGPRQSRPSITFTFKGQTLSQEELANIIPLPPSSVVINEQVTLSDSLCDLEYALAEGIYIPENVQQKLGIYIDYTPLSKKDRKHIPIQAAAQVIGYQLDEFNAQHVKNEMFNNDKLFGILPLDEWKSVRDYDESEAGFSDKDRAKRIVTLISSVNPIPIEKRRGRKPYSARSIEVEPILIPSMINPKTHRVNYQKVNIAIEYIAKVLVIYGH